MSSSALLNSGKISEFTPFGQGGSPVYKNADAFCNAIIINADNGKELANHLANPKVGLDGDAIDWYIPFRPANADGQYRIIHWSSASAEEQQEALAKLRDFEFKLSRLGEKLSRKGDSSSKLFASYLTGSSSTSKLPAIHFPGPEYVYIVDGIPVITFWGFTSRDEGFEFSPIEKLKSSSSAAFAASATGAGDAAFAQGNAQQSSFNNGQVPPYQGVNNGQVPPQDPNNGQGRACVFPPFLRWLLLLLLIPLLLALILWLLSHFGFLNFGKLGSVFDSSLSPAAVEQPLNNDNTTLDEPHTISNVKGDVIEELPPEQAIDPNVALVEGAVPNGQVQGVVVQEVPVGTASATEGAVTLEEGAALNGGVAPNDPALDGSVVPADNAQIDSALAEQNAATNAPMDAVAPVDPMLEGNAKDAAANEQNAQGDKGLTEESQTKPMTAREAAIEAARQAENEALGLSPVDPQMPAQNEKVNAAIEAARQAENEALGLPPVDPNMPAQNAAASAAKGQVSPVAPVDIKFTEQDIAKAGVKVVNGNWSTRSALMDSNNGRPLQMAYELKDGKGKVTVTRHDGTKCVADVTSSTTKTSVGIESSSRAVCPDNSSYQIPKIKCQPQANGKVSCTGTANGQNFPIELYDQGKQARKHIFIAFLAQECLNIRQSFSAPKLFMH